MRAAAFLLALSAAGCGLTGPSEALTGQWVANAGGRFGFIEIRLQQTGDEITGTACAVSDGILLYSGVPVTGHYPNVQFTVTAIQTRPCCATLAGSSFRGRQDSSKDIVGIYRGDDTRFERSDRTFCE